MTAAPTSQDSVKSAEEDDQPLPQEQENVLISLLLNIIVPTLILSKLSSEDRLGPLWALIIAVIIPAGYGIWFAVSRKQANIYSILGMVSVLLTGVLGLVKAAPLWIAVKEAVMPLIIGAVILLSHLRPNPFVASILLNPQLVDRPKISSALTSLGNTENFRKLLWNSSLVLAATMIFSSIANFIIADYCLKGKEPGTSEFTEALGTINWVNFVVISLPLMVVMIIVLMKFMNRVSKLTGLTVEEFMINAKARQKEAEDAADDDSTETT